MPAPSVAAPCQTSLLDDAGPLEPASGGGGGGGGADDTESIPTTNMSPEHSESVTSAGGGGAGGGTSPAPGAAAATAREAIHSPPQGSKYMDDENHTTTTTTSTTGAGNTASSDVERFDGKIVYNPDGSAYIIEDSELSEEDAELLGDGVIVDTARGTRAGSPIAYPPIASAFYVSRSAAALYGALCAPPRPAAVATAPISDVPVMHSYRVYSVRGPNAETRSFQPPSNSVPVKPILMCFICKLSFGYAKSFVSHAMSDHSVTLLDDERALLARDDASAIIQCIGKDKEPLVSFLEPVSATPGPPRPQQLTTPRGADERKTQTPSPASHNGSPRVMDLTRKSPVSAASPGTSPSPVGSTLSPTQPFPPQPPPNFLTGTTIGVCPEHLGGRPSGVECPKCELILNSSRLAAGPLAGMHSRNSCKTLKCPKCNWHYKYQETLEIHMKEKHPETETSCIYCIAGQPHPRLARGETYTCGYKPYRCEVCNYSTTTKGNLSIHMQSDKHLNNMQELQNGGVPSGPGQEPHTPPPSAVKAPGSGSAVTGSSAGSLSSPHHPVTTSANKPKPTFRCDVCNYETNVARNLRIHMTSEKHTHNMMVLQQNVKHMQTLSALHQQHQQQQGWEALLHFHPGLTLPGDKPPPHTEAALADMAYNQALLIQMMTGGQLPPHVPPDMAPHADLGLNPEAMEPPPEPADPNPHHVFHCCVCNAFNTDSLEALSHHLAQDRTKSREQEILALVAGHYVCKLCSYKTNLKANFQLHCKTDKHLQRLQHVNHVKEGGPRNEWRLKYVSAPAGVQVRCHACDYYTNSAHKLQLHAAGQRHEASCLLFAHLREAESRVPGSARVYHCALCQFACRTKLPLLQHVRSMKHLQMEQLHQLQRRSEGKDLQTDISEVFQVTPAAGSAAAAAAAAAASTESNEQTQHQNTGE